MHSHNETRKTWQNDRRKRLKLEWFELNGPCVCCGSNVDLQIDHVDKQQKTYESRDVWLLSEENRLKELKKCQVLCKLCHQAKNSKEMSVFLCGSESRYKKGCRCANCRKAHSYYEFFRKHGAYSKG